MICLNGNEAVAGKSGAMASKTGTPGKRTYSIERQKLAIQLYLLNIAKTAEDRLIEVQSLSQLDCMRNTILVRAIDLRNVSGGRGARGFAFQLWGL